MLSSKCLTILRQRSRGITDDLLHGGKQNLAALVAIKGYLVGIYF
jgi:hypothetical protein